MNFKRGSFSIDLNFSVDGYSSLDPYRAILRCVADEGYAFTTKARCPALILFEMERHPAKDVASFLKHDVPGYPEKEIQVQIDLTDNSENDGEAVDVSDVSADMSNDDGQFVESGSKFREKGNEIVWNIGEASKYSNVKMVTTFNGETIMGESFAEKTVRVRSSSAFQHLTHWELDGLIAKSNDDLRQEVNNIKLLSYTLSLSSSCFCRYL